jgi:hypothetical protein
MGMTMDENIAHVARVMVPSLSAFRGEPVLSPAYWRKRLERILDVFHLTDSQVSTIGRLLRELDQFEAERSLQSHGQGAAPWDASVSERHLLPKIELTLRRATRNDDVACCFTPRAIGG